MISANIYDIEYREMEEVADEHEISMAELVQAMWECFKDNNGEDYL